MPSNVTFATNPAVHHVYSPTDLLGSPMNKRVWERRLSSDIASFSNMAQMSTDQLRELGKDLDGFGGKELIIGVDTGADQKYVRFRKDQNDIWYRTDLRRHLQPSDHILNATLMHGVDSCEVIPVQEVVNDIATAASDAAKAFASELGMKGTIPFGGSGNSVISVGDLAAHIRSEAARHATGTQAAGFQRLTVARLDPGSSSDATRVDKLAAGADRLLIGSGGYFWVLHKAPYEADLPLPDENGELTGQWRGNDDQWTLYDMQKGTQFGNTQTLPDFMGRLQARGFDAVEIAFLPPQEKVEKIADNVATTQQAAGNAAVAPDPSERLAGFLSGSGAPKEQDRLVAANLAELIWPSS